MRWKKIEARPETYWLPWFAWHPATIEDTGERVWLETIWRHVEWHGGFDGSYPSYRYRGDIHWHGANIKHLPE